MVAPRQARPRRPIPSVPISAVVTGAARGVGRQVCRRLIAANATVIAVDRDARGLEAAAAELGADLIPVAGDVTGWEIHELAAEAATQAGDLRWWVNDADPPVGCFRTLQRGMIYGASVAVRRMRRTGGGAIVNVLPSEAETALVRSARTVAADYGRFGIRADVILQPTTAREIVTVLLSNRPAHIGGAEVLAEQERIACA
jgi:NAD(P)-dependent dehydrogenase (short-subunit alcohol dehydrogenase family)